MSKDLINKLLIALSIFFVTSTNCMERNNTIGTIDKLMLKRSVEEDGYFALRKKICTLALQKSAKRIPKDTPFVIEHRCLKKDHSILSYYIFPHVNKKTIKTPCNRIDYCTTWTTISDKQSVIATATFYDLKELLKTLKTFKK